MSLREFIYQHNAICEVADIRALVDPDTQMGEQIHAQMQKRNPAIMWFHNLAGTPFSVVANLFATQERLNRVLSYAGKSVAQRLEQLTSNVENWTTFCTYIRQKYPCVLESASASEVSCSEIDSLYDLPQIRYWSGDTSTYFSLPTVFSCDFDSDEINAGIYRLSPIDAKRLTINWRRGSSAYSTWQGYASRGERMPLTIAMGVDPALTFASMFPLPEVGAELALWSFIRGSSQRLRCNRDGLPVPEDAEIVIEGYVDPCQRHEEGSFANHTGFYTESAPCPIMHVNSIRARHDAVMPITLVGPPPTENTLLGSTIWQLLFVYIRRELPYLTHLICPIETANLPVVIIQTQAPTDVAVWEERKRVIRQHSVLKRIHTLILVDEKTDISNLKCIYWHCMNLETESYSLNDSPMRIIDGVLWRYQGKRKVIPVD